MKTTLNPFENAKRVAEGTGGASPAVIEEMQAEISVLGSQNTAQTQDIIDIKGSLNSINDNLNKHTISNNTVITLSYNTEYTTLTDGYFKVAIGAAANGYIQGTIDGVDVILIPTTTGSGAYGTVFVRKGSIIKYTSSNRSTSAGLFYPLE